MATIINAIGVIKELIALIKLLMAWVEERRVQEAEEKRLALEKAIEDSKKAETDAEIWDSQERIVDNMPKP